MILYWLLKEGMCIKILINLDKVSTCESNKIQNYFINMIICWIPRRKYTLNTNLIKIKYSKITGSYAAAKETAEILRTLIGHTRWSNAKHLIEIIKSVGKRMTQAKPMGKYVCSRSVC